MANKKILDTIKTKYPELVYYFAICFNFNINNDFI